MLLTRELVTCTVREVPDEGPEPGWTPLPDDELDLLTVCIDRKAGADPIWVFAYGSLIWNPGFEVAERERATAYGWHRAFSLKTERWRATSEQPGLMMARESGGRCDGLNLRLPDEHRRENLRILLRREIRYREVVDMVRRLWVRTPDGNRRSLTFWAGVKGDRLAKRLPLPEVAFMLARDCGPADSCAEYLHNTVAHLKAEGIRDRNLWRLQTIVAADLRQRHFG